MIQKEQKNREAFFRSLMIWEHVSAESFEFVFANDTDTDSYIDAFFTKSRLQQSA